MFAFRRLFSLVIPRLVSFRDPTPTRSTLTPSPTTHGSANLVEKYVAFRLQAQHLRTILALRVAESGSKWSPVEDVRRA